MTPASHKPPLPSQPNPARAVPLLCALGRLAAGGLHVARGWWLIRFRFPELDAPARATAVQDWAQRFLRLWRIELHTQGSAPQGPVLLVSNHISWLDILVVLASTRCQFVGKNELARWPILGTLIAGAGTVFISRNTRRDALRVVGELAQALQEGRTVLVFPESVTSDGQTVLPFHGNLFEAALAGDHPIGPLALSYSCVHQPGQLCTAPAYVGETSLLTSVWRTLRKRGLQAHVQFLPAQMAQGRTRRQWAAEVRQAIVLARQQHLAGQD